VFRKALYSEHQFLETPNGPLNGGTRERRERTGGATAYPHWRGLAAASRKNSLSTPANSIIGGGFGRSLIVLKRKRTFLIFGCRAFWSSFSEF
jgi:hypothetical protein